MLGRLFKVLTLILSLTVPAAAFGVEDDFSQHLAPFIQKHCVECHGADVQKAKLRLDTLKPQFNERDPAAIWIKALDKIASGQMPPATEARPHPGELRAATDFLA